MAVYEDVARLVVEVQGSQSLDEAKQKVQEFSDTLTGSGGAGGGGHNLQQSVQAASYAFQDFMATSGDLGQKLNSITNNIPALLSGLGSLGTGIGLLVTAGVALYRNWDELTIGAEEVKRRHDEMTQSIKEETAALEALAKVRTEEEAKAAAARKAGVAEAIAPDREQIRKALAEDIRRDLEAERERLTAEIFGRLPPGQRDFAALMADPRFARVWRRIGAEQREADLIIGRAIEGGAPELGRLRQLFGPETQIGERLALAGPEAAEEAERLKRAEELRKRTAAIDEQNARRKERLQQENARAMEAFMAEEERDLKEQAHEDKDARTAKTKADREAAQAARHQATVRQHEATVHAHAVHQEAALAAQRFGKTAELMAEQGFVGGMTEAQVRGELARRLGREGIGREAAQEAATRATDAALGRLTDLGGRGSELLRRNAEMTRQMAERLHQQERAIQEAERNLRAANQTNRKTGN